MLQELKFYQKIAPLGGMDFFFGLGKEVLASFLTLYLIRKMGYPDQDAYDLISRKEILSYVLPFLAALWVSQSLSPLKSLRWGLACMALGFFLMAQPFSLTLYGGLSFFLFGYGLGRPVIPLLTAKLARDSQEQSRYLHYLYALGVLAGLVGPFLVGLWEDKGQGAFTFWVIGFLCLLGLLHSFFLENEAPEKNTPTFPFKDLVFLGFPLTLTAFFFFPFLSYGLLGITLVLCVSTLYTAYKKEPFENQRTFKRTVAIMGAIVFYFALQSQQYLLFPVFIESFVDRQWAGFTLPTPWFYGLTALSVFIVTPVFLKYFRQKRGAHLPLKLRVVYGSMVMSMALAMMSSTYPPLALLGMTLVFALMGVGGMVLVPLAQEGMALMKEEKTQRYLMGALYLSMALARFLGLVFTRFLSCSPTTSDPECFVHSFTSLFILSLLGYLGLEILLRKARV